MAGRSERHAACRRRIAVISSRSPPTYWTGRSRQRSQKQIWLADLTYISTGEGWLYLAAIMDLHTRKIVGWSTRDHLRAERAASALTMAIQRQRPNAGLIQHSDRGTELEFNRSSQRQAEPGWHHAVYEPASRPASQRVDRELFPTLKTERTVHKVYRTRDQARADVFDYIEWFYNPRRRHSTSGYLSPKEF